MNALLGTVNKSVAKRIRLRSQRRATSSQHLVAASSRWIHQSHPCKTHPYSGSWNFTPIKLHRDSIHERSFSTGAASDSLQDPSALPADGQLQLDFFGEPVTFLGLSAADKTTNAMAATDSFLLAIVSKGKTCIGGGGEAGLEATSGHAAALSWAEVLRHATVWNHPDNANKMAPMLAYTAVAPLLAQAGIAYVRHLDTLLLQARAGAPGLSAIQMESLIDCAVAERDNPHLNPRERLHLTALYYMRQDEHPTALATLLRLLRTCPGDALALSLVMDLAHTLGDKASALRYARLPLDALPCSLFKLLLPHTHANYPFHFILFQTERQGPYRRTGTSVAEDSFAQPFQGTPWQRHY